jgi:hypothetical protein
LIWIVYAEFIVFRPLEQWPTWALFATGFVSFFSFVALLPAAIVPQTTKAALVCVSVATLLGPLIEVVEVVGRSSFINPLRGGAVEYGRQLVSWLLLPAAISVLLGALLRYFRAR